MTSTHTTSQYNNDVLLQTSGDDSDLEEMLNEPPTFSQASQSYYPSQQQQEEEEEQSSTPSITKEENVEEQAQFKAKHLELTIADDINSPSDLYWHRQSKKKEPYPCRLCQESELVLAPQLQTKPWNKTTQVLIQFMGEYQPNQRQLVLKSQLTPFYGTQQGETTWCPSLVQEYTTALAKKKSYTGITLRVEELYLDKVLQRARENQAAAIQTARERETEAKRLALESDERVDAPLKPPPPPRRAIKSLNGQPDDISHKLRAGDVIEYTNPMFVSGHKDGYRHTTILSIHKKEEYPLVLQNAEFLPRSHLIRRVQRMVRKKLVEYNGNFRPISDFRMEYDNHQVSASLKEQAQEVGRIVDKHVAKYQPKLEAVGLPMDLLHNMGGKKRARGGKENETEVAVNEDLKMAAIASTGETKEPPNKKRLAESPFKQDTSCRDKPKTMDSGETASVQQADCGEH